MALKIEYQPYTLHFTFEAGTSRGVLTQKTSWLLRVTDDEQPGIVGLGECGPLDGLSVDAGLDFEHQLISVCTLFNSFDLEVFPFNLPIILQQVIPTHLPSVRFGIEMALLDFLNGGHKVPYPNAFSQGKKPLPINGLIWMGAPDFMARQIEQKLAEGYTTLKLKVGALDFEAECALLESLRKRYSAQDITLRLDANGAFSPEEAPQKLQRLAQYELHSIEQPIRAGQPDRLAELVQSTPVPIALDEELIGKFDYMENFN